MPDVMGDIVGGIVVDRCDNGEDPGEEGEDLVRRD